MSALSTRRDESIVDRLVIPASVTQTFAILAVRGAGKTNAARAMAEAMFDLKLPFVAIDPVGSWWGLRSGRDGKAGGLSIPVFGGKHGDLPLSVESGVLLADLIVEKRLSCVVDMSTFDSEGSKKKFLLFFAQRLYQKNEDPLHLFLEEADDYIPQKPFRDEAQLLRAWENIVRRGRARGLGMTMITQRSAKINKDVLTQAETLITLRTTSPQDRAAVEAWVKYHAAAQEIIESLSGLADGEAWVWSPHFLSDTFRGRFPLSRTFDSGATPKNARAGDRRAPASMADIDLDELKYKFQATIEKAKQDDPRELRKEIGALKALLAQAGKDRPTPPDARAVEKAVEAARRDMQRQVAATFGPFVRAVRAGTKTFLSLPWPPDEFQPEAAKVSLPAAPPVKSTPAGEHRPVNGPADAAVTTSMRKILIALAQNPAGMDTARLAALSGYTVNGHFNNLVGSLRASGFVTPARVMPIQITPAGLGALGDYEPMPVGEELRQYWLNRVGPSKAKILAVLFAGYPRTYGTEELANLAGYTVNGHFNNLIGSLRTMGLITAPRQPIKAMDYLFEE